MTNKKSTQGIVVKEDLIATSGNQAEVLIARAIDKDVSVETMEKLLAMRRELKHEWAKEQFDKAVAKFQKECPVIEKTKAVFEKDRRTVRYKYAPIDVIISQAKECIADNGLSYALNVEQDDKMLTVICNVKHESGHAEESRFSVPIGNEGFMSDVQKYGARCTFAKRYAFCNAFGILTGDEDNDAVEDKKPVQNNYKQAQPVQKTTQPVQPPPKVVSESEKKKMEIVKLCNKLGIEDKTKTGYSFFVQDMVGSELIEENYDDIISNLEIADQMTDKDKAIEGDVLEMPKKDENESEAKKKMREAMEKAKKENK
jgi:hypothetical protein